MRVRILLDTPTPLPDTKRGYSIIKIQGKGDPLNEKLLERIEQYTTNLQAISFLSSYSWKFNDNDGFSGDYTDDEILDRAIAIYELSRNDYEVKEGAKFLKIVSRSKGSTGGSAHAFVEKETGKLVKTASWNSPAKKKNGELQSKYNLLDDDSFELLLKQSDQYGGHLYVR
jgi:hypothetical protein